MPPPPLTLDDRTFEDLVREARLRIPRYTQEWTDFNDSDPGMAIVQLFAWFTEQMLVQFNQVPDRNRQTFLKLLNLRPRPARPSTVQVTFIPQGGAKRRGVDTAVQFPTTGTGGQPAVFETTEVIDLVPHPLSSVQVFNGADFEVQTEENVRPDRSYAPFGSYPQVNNALYLGFEPSQQSGAEADFPTWWRVTVFLPPDLSGNPPPAVESPQLTWEYTPKTQPGVWRPLEVKDGTNGFTQEGNITIARPDKIDAMTFGRVSEKRYWVRARIAAKPYPPGSAPRVAFLRTNTVQVINLATATNEELQQPDGDRRGFTLRNTPVYPDSLKLVLEVPGRADEEWREVPDFFGKQLTRDSAVYTLDPVSGAIRTGDGRHGRIPEPGSRLVARSYQYGGGAGGNVGIGAISTPPADFDAFDVKNERPAYGGQDQEAIASAVERAPLVLSSRGQAVSAQDFRLIAENVPCVARAVVQPCMHPDFPGAVVPGVVTVVVVPTSGGDASGPPAPSPQLMELVGLELDKRRLIGTEVVVTKPDYLRVKVEVELVRNPSAAFSDVEKEVTRRVMAALRPYPPDSTIDPPVRPGPGPGETFYPTALYEVVLSATDRRKQRLVSVVTNLRVARASDEPIKVKPLGPAEVLWCDGVTVTEPPGGRT